MSENSARAWVTTSILGGDLLICFAILALWLSGGYSSGEFKQTMLVLTPLLFAYALPIVKYTLAERNRVGDEVRITSSAFWIAILISPILQVTVLAICILKAFNIGFQTFDDFTLALGVLQTVFGAIIGLVISTFFPAPSVAGERIPPHG